MGIVPEVFQRSKVKYTKPKKRKSVKSKKKKINRRKK